MKARRASLIAVLLSVVLLALAILGSPEPEVEPVPAVPPLPASASSGAPGSPESGTDHVSGWVATALERPLFAPDRRPAAVAAAPEAAPEDTGPGPIPRLAGIVIGRAGKRALFQPQGSDKPQFLGEGAKIAGWQVEAIAPDGVTLSGPNGKQVVKPKADPSLQPAGPDTSIVAPEPAPAPGPQVPAPAPAGKRPSRSLGRPGQSNGRRPMLHHRESRMGIVPVTTAWAEIPTPKPMNQSAPSAPELR